MDNGFKYGIDWNKENEVDGGYLDDRIVQMILEHDETMYDGITGDFKETLLKRSNYFYSSLLLGTEGCNIRFDKNTNMYYLVLTLRPSRKWSSSILSIRIDDPILDKKFEETIELPRRIEATIGDVKLVIPTSINEEKLYYDIVIEYKDSKSEEWEIYSKNDRHSVNLSYNIPEIESDKDIICDKNNFLIEYGFCDYTYDGEWKRIEGIVPYKNEEGIWTSDVVKNPEKYLESHLDWYYSDERMVDYIEERGLLPQYKIDAIRAANYEDIFSMEYKIKHYGFIFLIIFFALIIAIVVRNIIKRKQKSI